MSNNTGWFYGNYLYNGNPVDSGLLNSVGGVDDPNAYINNQLIANANAGSTQDIMNNIHDRMNANNLWDIFKNGLYNNYKQNPVGFSLGVAGMGAGLWNAYNAYKNQRESLALQKEAYNLQKQFALNAEQRNQEQWDMMKRQRASSAL